MTFDGRPQQLRPEKGELPLSLAPGAHSLLISWEESRDVSMLTHPSTVDLRSPASNLTFGVALPDSRWILAAWGPGVGPAVLYWGELVVFIGVAWLLGRWTRSPLGFTEWLLLGLGLSTQSWFVFCLTAAWLVAMRWREDWKPGEELSRLRFNAVQLVLAAFTFFTILTLVFSGIRNGLLAYPDMHITGGNALRWRLQLVSGSDRGVWESQYFLGADVGLSHVVLRLGELDGVRAGALAALGVQRVEDRRVVAHRVNGVRPHFPAKGAGLADLCATSTWRL